MEQENKFVINNLNVFWGKTQALRNINIKIPSHMILGIIGPSGSGKTLFLRSLNRMNDLVPEIHIEGQILMDGEDIYHPATDPTKLRKKVGMVFALPVPLPGRIYDNIIFNPALFGV